MKRSIRIEVGNSKKENYYFDLVTILAVEEILRRFSLDFSTHRMITYLSVLELFSPLNRIIKGTLLNTRIPLSQQASTLDVLYMSLKDTIKIHYFYSSFHMF